MIDLRPSQKRLVIADRPTIDLGVDGSGATSEFHRIRAIVHRRDGSFVVANGAPLELRVFDRGGNFVRTIGRKGRGPGEFEDITTVTVLAGDSLLVADGWQRRFVVFSPNGEHVRTVALTAPNARRVPDVLFALADGTLIASSFDVWTAAPRPEPYYFGQHLFVADARGVPSIEIGAFQAREHFVQKAPPEQGGVAYWDLAYGRKMTLAAHGNRILSGDGSSFELRYFSARGKLEEILRSNESRAQLTALDRDMFKARLVQGTNGARRIQMTELADAMPFPQNVPSFSHFIVAQDGRIWAQRYPRPLPKGDFWVVLEADGRFVDEVTMPPRFSLMAVGRDHIMGIGRDDDDVQHVQTFAVTIRR